MSHKIVVIGDIILDQYHFGEVKRLNPESPMPLININKSEFRLGGAANVAANIITLGWDCVLIGNIGEDSHGDVIKKICTLYDIEFHPIMTEQPTISKARYIETTYNQQILRTDFEEAFSVDWGQIKAIIQQIKDANPDIIICSDYVKWVLQEDLIREISITFPNTKILVDTKPHKFMFYTNVFIFKPNFKEFKEVIGKDIENLDDEIALYGKSLAVQLNANVVVTRGSQWASIITQQWETTHLHTEAKTVFDVSGAGDTFLAGIAVKLNEWQSLENAVIFGNKASGVAVGKIGTALVGMEEVI